MTQETISLARMQELIDDCATRHDVASSVAARLSWHAASMRRDDVCKLRFATCGVPAQLVAYIASRGACYTWIFWLLRAKSLRGAICTHPGSNVVAALAADFALVELDVTTPSMLAGGCFPTVDELLALTTYRVPPIGALGGAR